MSKANIAAQRFYGIDLLRLLAAAYVMVLHVLLQGGVYFSTAPYSHQSFICQILLSFAYCSVTLFGLISGYVGYTVSEKNHNFLRYGMLWLEVVFYGLIITLCCSLFFPVSRSVIWDSLFPVTRDTYWYFTDYTLLFFFIPILNTAVHQCNDHTLKVFFFSILLFFSPLESYSGLFNANRGYSFLWLMILYLLGAIIRKLQIGQNIHPLILICSIVCLSILTATLYTSIPKLSKQGVSIDAIILDNYTFPLYLFSSVAHIILFTKLEPNILLQKVIRFFAPGAFAVYLVNVHPLVWRWMKNRFCSWAGSSVPGLLVRVTAFSLLFTFTVAVLDFLRRKLFQILHIKSSLQFLFKKAQNF